MPISANVPAMTLAGIDWASPRAMTLTGLVLAAAAAWLALAALHGEAGLAVESLAALCARLGLPAGFGAYPAVLAIWLLMSVAMMLPTALPTIDLYVRLARRMEAGRGVRIALFVAGYLIAWSGFGALAAAGQVALATLPPDLMSPLLAGGALLVLTGTYQLSPLKQACLDLCRNPMLFFMARWRESPGGTLWLGIQHGLICIGCCWALMALMFLGGAMNLAWMAALGLIMLAEKILPGAKSWGRAAGVLMIAAGAASVGATLI